MGVRLFRRDGYHRGDLRGAVLAVPARRMAVNPMDCARQVHQPYAGSSVARPARFLFLSPALDERILFGQ